MKFQCAIKELTYEVNRMKNKALRKRTNFLTDEEKK